MSQTPNDIEDFSPYKLLGSFSKNRILPCILLALLLHVLVIGGTSYNFIYYTWIDPDAKPAESATAEQAADEPAEESPSPETGSAESGAAGDTAAAGNTAGDSSTPADGSADSPVVRSITEEAQPDEIPSEPDGLGISIEDTNR